MGMVFEMEMVMVTVMVIVVEMVKLTAHMP